MNTPPPITKADFMDAMLEACPSFKPASQDFVEEWESEPIELEDATKADLPRYLALSELANHLIAMLERGETSGFPAIFGVVEDWVERGEHYVSEAAVIGLLEDLTATVRYNSARPSDFVPWLGPASKEAWTNVQDYWTWIETGKFEDHPGFANSKLNDNPEPG